MKLSILILGGLLLTSAAEAQYSSRYSTSAAASSSCECTQVRLLTGQDRVAGGQRDGTSSVCLFDPIQFNGRTSFEGGWHLTGDIVAYSCTGGLAGTGRTNYSSQPSPLCRLTGVREEVMKPGVCVHQGDLNRDNVFSSQERAAWEVKNAPITEGAAGYVGNASQMAIDFWDASFSLLLNGGNLCDKSYEKTEPSRYANCLALPVACRRLNFVGAINPRSAQQIKNAYSEYSNNLNECALRN